MHWIPFICIILFHIFFFVKSIWLSLQLKQPIRHRDKKVITTISWVVLTITLFTWTYYNQLFGIIGLTQKIWYGIMIIAVILALVSLIHIRQSWRIWLPSSWTTQLITWGIYAYSRNPFFLAYDLLIIGMIVVSWSWLVFIAWVFSIIFFHQLIIQEEQYLEHTEWITYLNYKKKVRRYL